MVSPFLLFLALLPGLVLAGITAYRAARLRLPRRHAHGQVTLILPLTGPAPGLEALLAALAAQTMPPRRLVVAVESAEDPAHARVQALVPGCPFPLQLVLAGRAEHRAAKNSGLIAAAALVDAADDAVVLLDADIRPQAWWLSALATPVIEREYDAVTGYRWQLLPGRGVIGHLVAWTDRLSAVLLRPEAAGLVWGGSLALSPAALRRLDLPALLDRALSDDLAIGLALRALGFRLLTRGAILVPTPAEGNDAAQWHFMRRQCQIIRTCRPGLWGQTTQGALALLMGWATAVALLPDPAALAGLLALSAAGLLRAVCQHAMAARIGAPDEARGLLAQCLIGLLPPLADGFMAVLCLSTLRTRRIRWRHVEYEVHGPFAVQVRRRFPA